MPQTLSHTFARSLVSSHATQNASWRVADTTFGWSKEMSRDECLPARLCGSHLHLHHPPTRHQQQKCCPTAPLDHRPASICVGALILVVLHMHHTLSDRLVVDESRDSCLMSSSIDMLCISRVGCGLFLVHWTCQHDHAPLAGYIADITINHLMECPHHCSMASVGPSCGSLSVVHVSLPSTVQPTCSASPTLCFWLCFAHWT